MITTIIEPAWGTTRCGPSRPEQCCGWRGAVGRRGDRADQLRVRLLVPDPGWHQCCAEHDTVHGGVDSRGPQSVTLIGKVTTQVLPINGNTEIRRDDGRQLSDELWEIGCDGQRPYPVDMGIGYMNQVNATLGGPGCGYCHVAASCSRWSCGALAHLFPSERRRCNRDGQTWAS